MNTRHRFILPMTLFFRFKHLERALKSFQTNCDNLLVRLRDSANCELTISEDLWDMCGSGYILTEKYTECMRQVSEQLYRKFVSLLFY